MWAALFIKNSDRKKASVCVRAAVKWRLCLLFLESVSYFWQLEAAGAAEYSCCHLLQLSAFCCIMSQNWIQPLRLHLWQYSLSISVSKHFNYTAIAQILFSCRLGLREFVLVSNDWNGDSSDVQHQQNSAKVKKLTKDLLSDGLMHPKLTVHCTHPTGKSCNCA